jgi:hypothetical protein
MGLYSNLGVAPPHQKESEPINTGENSNVLLHRSKRNLNLQIQPSAVGSHDKSDTRTVRNNTTT